MADKSDSAIENGNLSIDDMITQFGEGDDNDNKDDKDLLGPLDGLDDNGDKKDEKKDSKSKDDKDKDDAKDDKKDDKETEDEDELELINVPNRAEILKEFPNLFKKFPGLQRAIYREREYTEIFPTIEDARNNVEKLEGFQKLETEIISGNVVPVYKSLKETDPVQFKVMVDKLMDGLREVDADAHGYIIGDTIKKAVLSAFNSGAASKDEELQKAANKIYAFYFGDAKFELTTFSGRKAGDVINPEKDKLKEERESFNRERFEAAKDGLSTRVGNVLKSTIIEHIDKKNEMSSYVKQNAVNDALRQVDSMINEDTRFRKILDGLWTKAQQANYSQESINKIRAAWLTQARTLLPRVINKVRGEALKGSSPNSNNDGKKDNRNRDVADKVDKKSESDSSRNKNQNTIPKGTSTLDFLMQD